MDGYRHQNDFDAGYDECPAMQALGYAQAARQLEDAGELPATNRDAEIRKRINHDQARSWTTWARVDGPPI